jgi:hypothetical protein
MTGVALLVIRNAIYVNPWGLRRLLQSLPTSLSLARPVQRVRSVMVISTLGDFIINMSG